MTEFEPRISGVGSDRSANCAKPLTPLKVHFLNFSAKLKAFH